MLLKAILLAILVATKADVSELRHPRQLDLGPDTNQVTDTAPSNPRSSNFQQPGYLPPIEPAGAQNDPVVVQPTTPANRPTHHGRDLCSDPFHSFLCANLRPRRPITGASPEQPAPGGLTGANTFLEPSKVLAPPLNDLEEPLTTTTYRTTTTTTRRPTTTTTTRRPTTTTTRRPTTTTTTTTTTEKPIAPAPSNDVRTYLPPEPIAPAAASQDIAIAKPDGEEEHHHHHPHHHGRDLCSDPFHAFLCQPLKPRKRITGDLPNSLQGQNTFLSPQKVRPEPDISPQPSNDLARAYLPPSTTTTTTTRRPLVPQPSNEIERAYLPPSTTRRPPPPPPSTTRRPLIPQPSNEIERAYLPPSTTRRPPPPTTTVRIIPQPSNEIERAYLPPSTTRRPPPPPPVIRFRPEPSNEINRAYLPPSTTTTRRPTTTTTTTTTPAPRVEPQPSNVDRSYLPPIAPQPSNVDNTYLPPIEPAAANPDPAIAAPDDHHHHGSHGFKDICSDPFHSFLCTSPKPRTRITGALPSKFQSNGINPAPSNIDETKVRVLEQKTNNFRIVVVPKDEEAPQPSQQENVKVLPLTPKPEIKVPLASEPKPVTYNYVAPDNKLTLPSETKEVIGYDYPKPSSPLPLPTKGYSYPTPEKKLTLPTEIKPEIVPLPTTRAPSTVGYQYPKPDIKLPLPSEVNSGYQYPKPDNKLVLPSERKEVIGYDYPKPSTQLPLPTKGYNYPKPDLRLTLPSEQKIQSQIGSTSRPKVLTSNSNALPTSLKEAQERLKGSKVQQISNISTQNSFSDLIPVNEVEFPEDGSHPVKFGQRLRKRERQSWLIPPPGSHRL